MKLEQSFDVDAPLERVWSALIDVEHVAPCLPGASVNSRNDDGSYNGTFTIKIGPTTASYAGTLQMEDVDESAHVARMQANGTDRRGQGGAKATIVSRLTPAENGGTRVEVDTDYQITGRLARFGRGGMIEDISVRLLREFAQRLRASLVEGRPEGGAEPVGEPEPAAEPEPIAEPAAEPEPIAAAEPAAEPPVPRWETWALPETRSAEPEPGPELALAPEPEPAPEPVATEPTSEPEPPTPPQPTPPEPFDAGSVVSSVMIDRVRRNPAPLAFVVGLLLAFVLLRRGRRGS